eukprot:Skav215717  [mRNA]  locus=scaffold2573:539234:547841:- [translate_table: standard]
MTHCILAHEPDFVRSIAFSSHQGQLTAGTAEEITWPAIAQMAIRKARARASRSNASIAEVITLPETVQKVARARARERVARARVLATISGTPVAANLVTSAASVTKHRARATEDEGTATCGSACLGRPPRAALPAMRLAVALPLALPSIVSTSSVPSCAIAGQGYDDPVVTSANGGVGVADASTCQAMCDATTAESIAVEVASESGVPVDISTISTFAPTAPEAQSPVPESERLPSERTATLN